MRDLTRDSDQFVFINMLIDILINRQIMAV